ncbi:MAG: DUF2769 domain-containing protein [Coriobacteriia bacterium]|nr:DUF2769 domain-containing protein [Coriobacteriia bacterium]
MDKSGAASACICPSCPTYVDCDKRLAFCVEDDEESRCIVTERGCMCGSCPVEAEMGFMLAYYCTLGGDSARERVR